jgi:glycosyltransferase involved in cell wall biosynthesis
MTLRLAIITTHPVQYHAPLFQSLARSQALRVRIFFTWSQTADAPIADPGFGRAIAWDIPLLEGYEHTFVANVARRPGTDHFWGLRNPGLTRAIESWGADAILVFGWNSAAHFGAMRYFKGRIPVFFRGDSTLLDQHAAWRSVLRRRVLRWVYRHIDVALSVGSNNRDYFRWCGLPDARIALAPHAIDTARFSEPDGPLKAKAAAWRAELGIPARARMLLFAGKFLPKKEPSLLLEAFCRSEVAGHLILVGSGMLEQQLRARAKGRGDVHFLPFQNQQAMPVVYRLGEVFVLPSRGPGETWGLAMNEAMAAGRPVIASSKVGGARDLVRDGITGWTFEAGRADELTRVIRSALTIEPERLRAMGTAAQRMSAAWSIEAAASGIEQAVLAYCRRARSPVGPGTGRRSPWS